MKVFIEPLSQRIAVVLARGESPIRMPTIGTEKNKELTS